MKQAINLNESSFAGCLPRHLIVSPIHSTNPSSGQRVTAYLLFRLERAEAGTALQLHEIIADRALVYAKEEMGHWYVETPKIVPWPTFMAYIRRC